MSISYSREDVAYIGEIRSDRFMMPLISNGDREYFALYLKKINDLFVLMIGKDGIGELAAGINSGDSDDTDNSFVPLLVKLAGNSSGWYITTYDLNTNNMGSLVISNGNLTIANEGQPIDVTALDPSMNQTETLLSGVRYRIASNATVLVSSECQQYPEDNELGGLYHDCSNSYLDNLSSYNWNFINIFGGSYLVHSPSSVGNLPGQVAITQCITMEGTGYGSSGQCPNWTDYRGYNSSSDSRNGIIYYYSYDGTCGNSYTFTNWLDQEVTVSTSLGLCDSSDYICEFESNDSEELTCILDDDRDVGSEINEDLNEDLRTGIGLIDYPILLLIIIVGSIIIVVIVIYLFYNLAKSKSN